MCLKKNSVLSRKLSKDKLNLNEVDNSAENIHFQCNKYLKVKKIDIDTEKSIGNNVLIDIMKDAFELHMT